MAQHYFIGISIATPITELTEQFRMKYQLAEKYKVIPHMDDLHITLCYIGELDEAQRPLLETSLRKISAAHQTVSTAVNGLSFFGPSSGPRVVYLSVESSEALRNLQRHIARKTETILGLEKYDRFVPHITIAKKRKTAEKLQLEKEGIPPIRLEVEGFTLFKIFPKIQPSYEPIAYFPLKKS